MSTDFNALTIPGQDTIIRPKGNGYPIGSTSTIDSNFSSHPKMILTTGMVKVDAKSSNTIDSTLSTSLVGAATTTSMGMDFERSFGRARSNHKLQKRLGKNFTFGKSTRYRERCGTSGINYNIQPGDIAQYYDVNGQLKQAIGYNEVSAYVEDLLTATTEITLYNKTLENGIMTGEVTYDTGTDNQEAVIGAHHITTTNNTATALFSTELEDDSNYIVEYSIVGQSSGYSGTWTGQGVVTSSAATITKTTHKEPSHDGWAVSLDVSSGTFTINVTGQLLERVYWTAMVRMIRSTLNADVNSIVFSDNNYCQISADSDLKIDTTTSGNFSLSAIVIPYTAQKSIILCKEVSGITGSSRVTVEMESDRTVRLKIFTGSTTQTFITDGTLTLDKINHIVWTKSGTDINFYLNNGTPQNYTQTINPSLGGTEYDDWRIGADQSSNYANGIIRAVSICDVELSAAQVEEVASAMGDPSDTSITTANILAYWPLDETESASGFADESGNGHTAVEVGTLTFDNTVI